MTRLEFGKFIRCNNAIPDPGNSSPQASTYCRKKLDKLDKDGKPYHEGPCSVKEFSKIQSI